MDTKPEIAAAQALANAVNRMGFNNGVFAEQLCHNEHRTLQQSAMRAIFTCPSIWAQDARNNNFDLRNEATVKWARKVMDSHGEEAGFPRI